MRQIDPEEVKATRNPTRSDSEGGIATPQRNPSGLFHGWGPKLMVCALALAGIGFANTTANAATQQVALSACVAQDRGASLISNPTADIPAGVSARGTTVLQLDLSPSGHVDAVAVAQSAGDPLLDFEAMRVARASRYASASHNCNAVSDRVLYEVVFSE
jgi:TonB family protein